MAFFSRILKFGSASEGFKEQRAIVRHPVGEKFPVKVAVTFLNRDDRTGELVTDSLHQARPWGGRLINLSERGTSVGLSTAALARRGEPAQIRFALGKDTLMLPCRIIHFSVHDHYANCGLVFDFPNARSEHSLRQLVEPVRLGATLAPVPPAKLKQDNPHYLCEQYHGGGSDLLSLWRSRLDRTIQAFDFRARQFGIRWSHGRTELETYGLAETSAKTKPANGELVRPLTPAQREEVRWLFSLTIPNLARSVRPDTREFLGKVVGF